MRGEFIGVWSELWRDVWHKLSKHPDAPDDLFCELFSELNSVRVHKLDPSTVLVDIIGERTKAKDAFRKTRSVDLNGELAVVEFLESAHDVVEGFGSASLTNRYFVLVEAFIEKFSLRYELRRPFQLHPTLSGIFSRLMRELRRVTQADTTLKPLMDDFEAAVRDLKGDQSPRRVGACITQQLKLLEGLGQQCPGVTRSTLGEICNELNTWPHRAVSKAVGNLYGFANSYPNLRHAGDPASALREIELRDMIAITIVLTGFTPYMTSLLNSQAIYFE